ncbi:FtsK/SpoIIIE domain-containing protein, partial [Streptomyces alkaliphilus]|uniref:FtsK/SpoIIIE domain-containing protein n=1 Tax=Streptomyces alkaliphilus TaxID=1472722 RepID=UPI003F66CACB
PSTRRSPAPPGGTTPLDTTVKLTVTTADPSGRRTDHLLDVPEGATVGDLLPALVRAPAPPEGEDAPPAGGPTGSGAGTAAGAGAGTAPPDLYHGTTRLDPDLPLSACGVREGALLGLGAPLPEGEAEPGRPVRFPPPGDPTLVELRHVSGPGAGRVWRLGPGRHEFGTDRGCALRPDGDPGAGVPASGVWITVGADGSVSVLLPRDADPERCGLRSLTPPPPVDPDTGLPLTDEEPAGPRDGGPGGHSVAPPPPGPDGLPEAPPLPPPTELPRPTDGSIEWPAWADLALGDHLLRHGAPFEPDAAVNPSTDGVGVEYNRPPRLAPHLDDESLRLPGPPTANRGRAFPFLMIIMPLIMGLVLISLFRNFFFVIFVFFTPLMAISNWVMARRSGRRQHAEKLRLYRLRRAALESEMRKATVTERGLRNRAFPDPAALLLHASGPGRQLWERRRRDPDHLVLRLGTVTRASLKRIEDQARESHHRNVHWRLADVPYGVEVAECGVVGFTGSGDGPRALARWAVAQSAVLHSPRDLRIVVLTTDEHAESWGWVRWLPHLRGLAPEAVVALGNDPESTAHRVNELLSRLRARVQASSSALGRTLMTEPDILVVLDGARRLRDVPGVVELLTTGPAVRIFSLCLDERERLLPEECTVVVSAHSSRLTLRASGMPAVEDIRADLVTPAWCEEVARSLAPVRDVSVDSDSGLPADVRLLPLLDQEPPDPAKVVELWNRRPASTSFVLGRGYENLLRLDLVRDGPHGLVGGTTGSGKSELLQTLIASLAAVNRPDELTFVLVDYKGGSAFRECAELPHTLGMITDLDGHLVQRALASLDAELRRRETVLAEVEAKDHAEYRAKRARDPRLAPLPRLLIVIDEFATLVRELPGFVPGLINLAQRGRSLGLHLLLATQRPAGSVNNEIKANTNLRIALRVTDRSESQDIIDSPDAVTISPHTPGRALVRRGGGTPTAFQTAWVGAERPGTAPVGEDGSDEAASAGPARPVRAAELTWQGLGRPVVTGEEEDEGETVTEERPTDLGALVSALRQAADLLPDLTPGVRPWLPALPEHLTLRDLPPAPPTPPT